MNYYQINYLSNWKLRARWVTADTIFGMVRVSYCWDWPGPGLQPDIGRGARFLQRRPSAQLGRGPHLSGPLLLQLRHPHDGGVWGHHAPDICRTDALHDGGGLRSPLRSGAGRAYCGGRWGVGERSEREVSFS